MNKEKIVCKWNFDEVCCNADNREMLADFCYDEEKMKKCQFRKESE